MRSRILIALPLLLLAYSFSRSNLVHQTKIGVFDRDSVHAAYPAYARALDSAMKYDVYMDGQIISMTNDMLKKKTEYDSLQVYWSDAVKAVKMQELKDLRKNIDVFTIYSDSCKIVKKYILLDIVNSSIDKAAEKIRKKYGLDAVVEDDKTVVQPNRVFRCITSDIIKLLNK